MVYTEGWCHGWRLPFADGSSGTQTPAPLQSPASPSHHNVHDWRGLRIKGATTKFSTVSGQKNPFFPFSFLNHHFEGNRIILNFLLLPPPCARSVPACSWSDSRWFYGPIPSGTDMQTRDKGALRDRGRERRGGCTPHWLGCGQRALNVLWFALCCNAVCTDVHGIQDWPKLRVLHGSKQEGKCCTALDYVFLFVRC